MSTTIDEKVVEMRFDNKEFESNVQASMSTLDKLKQSLNFDGATKGFDSISKAAGQCDVSALGTAAESVSLKFSALQVVAVTALQNITNSAISAGEQLLSSLSVDNVVAGWEKYGNKTTSVATLVAQGYDLDEVTEQLERLNWYTDETSYNFTDMVANIAKFTASGQDLNTSVTAMEGIANWAALSGQNATTASNAMYQLAQAMSAGYMRLEDYKSIQNASMDTEEFRQKCIDAGVALGTLKENADGTYTSIVDGATSSTFTLSSFTTSLTKGAWLTSDVMMDVFNDYSNAVDQIYEYAEEKGITASEAIAELGDDLDEFGLKAFKAAQEARTWADVVDSVKDAVSTAWMNTFELIFGNYEEAAALWTELANTLYDVFAEPMNVFNEFLEGAMDNPFTDLLDTLDSITGATESITNAVADYGEVVDAVINGSYGNGQVRWDALTEAGYDWAYVQNLVNEELGSSVRHATDYEESVEGVTEATEEANEAQSYTIAQLAEMTDAELENLGLTEETIEALHELKSQSEKTGISVESLVDDLDQLSGRSLLIDSFRNIGQSLLDVMQAISDAWVDIFPAMTSQQLYDIIAAFHKFTTYLEINEDRADKITRTFKGLFAVIDIITTTVGGAFKIALKVISKMLGMVNVDILDVTASVGDAIVAFHDWLLSDSVFGKALTFVAETLASCIDAIAEWIESVRASEEVQAIFSGISTVASEMFTALQSWAEGFELAPSIQSALSWLADKLGKVWSTLVSGVTAIKEWIDTFLEIPEVKKALAKVSVALSTTFSKLKEHFSVGIDRIADFIDRVKSMDGLSLDNIKAIFKDFVDNVLGYFLNFDGIFDNLSSSLTSLKDTVKEKLEDMGVNFEDLGEKITGFVETVKNIFSNINPGSLLAIGLGAALIFFVTKIGSALTNIASPITAFTDLLETFTGTVKSLKLTAIGAAIMMMAGSIMILVFALLALTTVNDQGKLWSATGVLVVLIAALSGLAVAVSMLTKAGNALPAAAMLIALSGSLLILAIALNVIASLPSENLLASLGVMTVLVLVLIGVTAAIAAITNIINSATTAANLAGVAVMLIAFAASMYILVAALKELDEMGVDKVNAALPALLSMMGMLALIMIAMGTCGGLSAGAGVGALLMVIAIKLLMNVLDDVAEFDADKVYNNIEALILVLGTMFGLMLIASLAGPNAALAGVGLVLMASAMIIMMAAINIIADTPSEKVDAAMGTVTALIALFAVVIAASNLAGDNAAKAGVLLLAMSASILILAVVIGILAMIVSYGGDSVDKAVAIVEQLIVLMGALVAVSALSGKANTSSLIVLAVTIGILAIALGTLSTIDPTHLTAAAEALSMVIGMFAILVAATALVKSANTTLLILAGVVAVLGLVLYGLASSLDDTNSSLVAAEALSVLLLAMSAALLILSAVKSVSSSALIALELVTLVVAELAIVLGLLNYFDVSPSLETAEALSLLLIAMSAACLILSGVGALGSAAFVGVGALVTLITAMGTLMAAIGALATYYPDLEVFLETGISLLQMIGEGIGSFVGGIIDGFLNTATESLPLIGLRLSAFMVSLQPFIAGMSDIDETFANSVSILIGALTTLATAGIWDSFANLFSFGDDEDQVTKMCSYFGPLGEAIASFSAGLTSEGGLDTDAIDTAAVAMDSILAMLSSLVSFDINDEDLEGFKTSCIAYVEAMSDVGDKLSENSECFTDVTLFQNAAAAGTAFSTFAETIPKTGGRVQRILGETEIGTFGASCKAFVESMVPIAQALTDNADLFTSTTIFENATAAGSVFVTFAETVPKTGGRVQRILGETDISNFGIRTKTFAEQMVIVAQTLTDNAELFTDTSIFENATEAATYFVNFGNLLSATGGLLQALIGEEDISDFGNKCALFVESIVSASQTLVEGNLNKLVLLRAAEAGTALAEMADIVDDTGGFGKMSLTDFGGHLEAFGASLAAYYTSVKDVDTDKLSSVATKASQMVKVLEGVTKISDYSDSNITSLLTNLGSSAVEGFVSAFDGSYESVTGAVSTLLGYFTSSVSDQQPTVNAAFKNIITSAGNIFSASYTRFSALGHMVMYKFRDGAYDTLSSVKAKFTTMMNNIYEVLRLRYNSFYNVGVYLVKGFAKGINDSTYLAKNAAKDMADAAAKSAKSTLAEKSPSKVGYGIGAYFGQGFVNGIVTFEQVAYDTASDLGDMATSGLNSTLSKIADFVDFSIDAEPTIRPILDLSDVDSGASTIGNMLSGTRTLSINTDTARLTATSMNRIQNDTNGELLSAIRDLGKSMSGRTGNVYNVNGVTYDDGSNISTAVQSLIRAARIERRV